ncbi:MAG: NAD(P)H-quinone oxidoreductase [Paracoccus sp. (in: a-proteobacteria)]
MQLPDRQTAITITAAGGPEVLCPTDWPVPHPGPGQVLIAVSAAGVNRHDINQRAAGQAHDGTPVPGLEVCGRIAALGEGVTGFAQDARVMALVQGGGYAQFVLAEAPLIFLVPEGLTDAEAACLPEALFTAWWNFFGMMGLTRDGYALIHGGTSGVGHLALQALTALGYRVIATCGSEDKIAAALGFGAVAAFSYRDLDLAARVIAATGGQGISALLDMSAGAHLDQDLAMMAPDGVIAHLSPHGATRIEVPLRALMTRRVRITGSLLRPLELTRKAAVADRLRTDVLPLLGNRVRPVIAHSFALRDAADAHARMERGAHIGKIVLIANA